MPLLKSIFLLGIFSATLLFETTTAQSLPNTPECRVYANTARSAGASGTYGPLVQQYNACLRSANRRGPAPQVKYPPRQSYGNRPKVQPKRFKNYKKYQRCVARKTPCDKRCLKRITNKTLSHNAGIRCYQRCGAYKRLTACERKYGR